MSLRDGVGARCLFLMSAFRRRTSAPAQGRAPAAGVKPAPYDAPVPLLSSGVAALDDILCGGGVLAGSVLGFVPCAGTASESAAMLGAPTLGGDLAATCNPMAYAAAEAYTDLFLSYVTAQGLASHHVNVVIGDAADAFVHHLMSPADGTDEEKSKEALPTDSMQRMKIAWRYDRPEPQKPSLPASSICSVFDLSRRISSDMIRRAKEAHELMTVPLDTTNSFDTAWQAILEAAEHCKSVAKTQTPVLRICLRAFGSPMWMHSEPTAESVRFLVRLRALVRSLAMPLPGSSIPPIPTLVGLSLSSHMYMPQQDSRAGINAAQRLMHMMDACIGLSSFGATPGMAEIFPDFVGALRVYRTPSIGTLTNPSLRASVLRGMGAGSALQAQDGGAGGGENNLAFKVKRKRVAIETLHLDTEGEDKDVKKEQAYVRETPKPEDPKPVSLEPVPRAQEEPRPAADAVPQPGPATPPSSAKPRLFGGLNALRERGMHLKSVGRPQDYEF